MVSVFMLSSVQCQYAGEDPMILPFPPQSLNMWLDGWLVLLFLSFLLLFPREYLLAHLVALIPQFRYQLLRSLAARYVKSFGLSY